MYIYYLSSILFIKHIFAIILPLLYRFLTLQQKAANQYLLDTMGGEGKNKNRLERWAPRERERDCTEEVAGTDTPPHTHTHTHTSQTCLCHGSFMAKALTIWPPPLPLLSHSRFPPSSILLPLHNFIL